MYTYTDIYIYIYIYIARGLGRRLSAPFAAQAFDFARPLLYANRTVAVEITSAGRVDAVRKSDRVNTRMRLCDREHISVSVKANVSTDTHRGTHFCECKRTHFCECERTHFCKCGSECEYRPTLWYLRPRVLGVLVVRCVSAGDGMRESERV